MTQHTEALLETILTATEEIKAMVSAQRSEAELSTIHEKLNRLDRQHEAVRQDLRQILMLLAQTQTAD